MGSSPIGGTIGEMAEWLKGYIVNFTKDKGDIGLSAVILDLSIKEFNIFLPMSDHLPFDLIAYKDQQCYRIQVKYRKAKNNKIEVAFKSVYSNKKGVVINHYDPDEVDYFAIYCPDTKDCYYVRFDGSAKSLTFRIGGQSDRKEKNVHYAEEYQLEPRTSRGVGPDC